MSLEQGNRAAATAMELAQDRAGALTPLLTAVSAPKRKSSQERAPLKLIKGRGEKGENEKTNQQKEKN